MPQEEEVSRLRWDAVENLGCRDGDTVARYSSARTGFSAQTQQGAGVRKMVVELHIATNQYILLIVTTDKLEGRDPEIHLVLNIRGRRATR